MYIRPALDPASETEGARYRVRDPHTMAFLADAGEEKSDSEYWHRRLLEKGVERCEPPGDDAGKAAPATTGPLPVEVHADADGTATFTGDHPATPALPAEETHA